MLIGVHVIYNCTNYATVSLQDLRFSFHIVFPICDWLKSLFITTKNVIVSLVSQNTVKESHWNNAPSAA